MADFNSILERSRLDSREIFRKESAASQLWFNLSEGDVHVGPGEYVPWPSDPRRRHIPSDKSREMLEEFIAGNNGPN
jgi:myo-inositol-1-phosphate synthase